MIILEIRVRIYNQTCRLLKADSEYWALDATIHRMCALPTQAAAARMETLLTAVGTGRPAAASGTFSRSETPNSSAD